jgi:plasmanylethanolamine desaturase
VRPGLTGHRRTLRELSQALALRPASIRTVWLMTNAAMDGASRADDPGCLTRSLEMGCLAGAAGLLALHAARLFAVRGELPWWTPALGLIAIVGADCVSGVVHWAADSWGSETMPIIGRRFLRPFRVHHVNPDDFLRRDFVDCNGDVALVTIPLLLLALRVPLAGPWGPVAAFFIASFCAAALPTNQLHQWAHQPVPPPPVAWLQDRGLILSREAHRRHHARPHTANYCIVTGWCNRPLTVIGLFPAMERLAAGLTGRRPRGEQDTP